MHGLPAGIDYDYVEFKIGLMTFSRPADVNAQGVVTTVPGNKLTYGRWEVRSVADNFHIPTPPPVAGSLTISDAVIVEGDAGTKFATVMVKREGGTAALDAKFNTTDGSAKHTSDFIAKSGSVHFAAGEKSKAITIQIRGDNAVESNETFSVNLLSATNKAKIAD